MSYIDALFDRDHDRIHIVGRRDSERYYEEHPATYIFYYDDPRGKFRSIFGTPVARFSGQRHKHILDTKTHENIAQYYYQKINELVSRI